MASNLFQKKDLSDKEHIIKYSLLYLGMKKCKPDAIEKIMNDAA